MSDESWGTEMAELNEHLQRAHEVADRMVALRPNYIHEPATFEHRGEVVHYQATVFNPVRFKSLRSRIKAMRREIANDFSR